MVYGYRRAKNGDSSLAGERSERETGRGYQTISKWRRERSVGTLRYTLAPGGECSKRVDPRFIRSDQTEFESPNSSCPNFDFSFMFRSSVDLEICRIPPTLALHRKHRFRSADIEETREWDVSNVQQVSSRTTRVSEQSLVVARWPELLQCHLPRVASESYYCRWCHSSRPSWRWEEGERFRFWGGRERSMRYSSDSVRVIGIPIHLHVRIRCQKGITSQLGFESDEKSGAETYLMQSISIKCCSATLFSLLTFLWRAVKMLFLSNNAFPQSTFNFNKLLFGFPASSVPGNSPLGAPKTGGNPWAAFPFGGIAKYSSSSRSTMMACLRKSGFCMLDWASGDVRDKSRRGPSGNP